MLCFNFFGTFTLTALFLIYMFKHFIYTMFTSDRVVLIIQQIVSLILYIQMYCWKNLHQSK